MGKATDCGSDGALFGKPMSTVSPTSTDATSASSPISICSMVSSSVTSHPLEKMVFSLLHVVNGISGWVHQGIDAVYSVFHLDYFSGNEGSVMYS